MPVLLTIVGVGKGLQSVAIILILLPLLPAPHIPTLTRNPQSKPSKTKKAHFVPTGQATTYLALPS